MILVRGSRQTFDFFFFGAALMVGVHFKAVFFKSGLGLDLVCRHRFWQNPASEHQVAHWHNMSNFEQNPVENKSFPCTSVPFPAVLVSAVPRDRRGYCQRVYCDDVLVGPQGEPVTVV